MSHGMTYFLGSYHARLDSEGRFALPAPFVAAFHKGGIVVADPDGCLGLYPRWAFEELAADLVSYLGGFPTWRVEIDREGRMALPMPAVVEADLDGALRIVGCGESLEIWSERGWREESERLERDLDLGPLHPRGGAGQ